jgi:hypothetical protein
MMPNTRSRIAALVVSIIALGLFASVVGCGKKDDAPNAPGYYTGAKDPKPTGAKPANPPDAK